MGIKADCSRIVNGSTDFYQLSHLQALKILVDVMV